MKKCLFLFLFLGLFLAPSVLAEENYDGYLIKYKSGKIEKSATKPMNIMSEGEESDIKFIQPNYIYETCEISENDKYWYLKNTGQIFQEKSGVGIKGRSGVDLGKEAADELTRNEGKQEIIVAVLDLGVDYNDTIFTGKLWNGENCKNELGETMGGCKNGYDFVNNDKDPLPNSSEDHGTHVAGIVASIAPNAKLMILRVGAGGTMPAEAISRAIDFAKVNGAKVINASFASSKGSDGKYPDIFDLLMYDSIKNFDGLFINAAGNENTNIDTGVTGGRPFPASLKYGMGGFNEPLKNIFVVSATNYYDDITYFSNFGKDTVDIAAMGAGIYGVSNNGGRVYYQGTSMATPMVSGVAAYLLGLRPSMSVAELISLISGSGIKAEGVKGMVLSGRRLNLETAVRKMKNMEWDRESKGSEGVKRLSDGKIGGGIFMEINSKYLPEFLYLYLSDMSNSLRLTRCSEMKCESVSETKELLKGGLNPIAFSLTADDRPIILSGGTFSLLKICKDKDCIEYKDVGSGNYGVNVSINGEIDVDSKGRIVWTFYTADRNWVILNRCDDAQCTSYQSWKTASMISNDSEAALDLKIDKSDRIFLAYNEQISVKKLIKCDDNLSDSCDLLGTDNQSIYGYGNALAIDKDDNLYWLLPASGGLKLSRCLNGDCQIINSLISVSVDSGSLFMSKLKMVMNVGGVPMITIGDDGDKYGVKIIKCKDKNCSQSETVIIDNQYGVGESMRIKSGAGGMGGVAYLDTLSADLKYHSFLNYFPVKCSENYFGKNQGDYNCDNLITGGDYIVWRREFLDKKIGEKFESDGDGDGRSSLSDYSLWREEYLK